MAKITNIRERVHQPFRDCLIRTSGNYVSNVQDRTDLFTQAGGDQGRTNLQNGSTLPSDQSMVVLALRVFAWFRNPQLRAETPAGDITRNGDLLASDFVANQNTGIGSAEDVHRLYFQTEEQLLWSVGAGQKYSMTSMPTAYFPYAGGLHGRLPRGGQCCAIDDFVPDFPLPGPINQPASVVAVGLSCCTGYLGMEWATNRDGSQSIFVGLWDNPFFDGAPIWATVVQDTPASFPFTFNPADYDSAVPACFSVTIDEPGPTGDVFPYFHFWVINGSGNCSSLILWNNGAPTAESLTKLARAILMPPRQNLLVSAQIVSYADNPTSPVATQGSRNLLSLTSNLNQQDYINKIISMTLDGLLSRDVQ